MSVPEVPVTKPNCYLLEYLFLSTNINVSMVIVFLRITIFARLCDLITFMVSLEQSILASI